jgi:hypothetical protein
MKTKKIIPDPADHPLFVKYSCTLQEIVLASMIHDIHGCPYHPLIYIPFTLICLRNLQKYPLVN